MAVTSRVGRYLLSEAAVLARVGGRHEPWWPLFAVWRGCSGPCQSRHEPCWPLPAVRRGCSSPISVAAMSRIGRYLLSEVVALARIGGRYEP